MALIDDVKAVCDRLTPHGWRDLLLEVSEGTLDIAATSLKAELAKELPRIRRDRNGFQDFAFEGNRGIEPGNPARSLLHHALASPNVVQGARGFVLTDFPSLREIEIVENYVFGSKPPSLRELSARSQRAFMALVVFASEYRPAPETVHRKHADMCFSRTGVARVGTAEALYDSQRRGFLPFVERDDHAIRVLPARYSAYVAIQLRGDESKFGPMRFRKLDESQKGDENRLFWVPLHKLFSGPECIRGLDLHVTLNTHHVNEKIRRIHLELGRRGYKAGWKKSDISKSPFIFTDGIADWSQHPDFGTGLLMPVVHLTLVEPAQYQGNPLTFKIPKNYGKALSSSLVIPAEKNSEGEPTWRHAPEYVHARHKVLPSGQLDNLNDQPDVVKRVKAGDYKAQHYIDFTGDGWIEALCPELGAEIPRRVPAYSLVTAPDFFPDCDQRELMDWWEQSVPDSLRENIWGVPPFTLSDERIAPNLELKGANFRPEDNTVTAIVSMPLEETVRQMELDVPETNRHAYLPDAASGVFAPGWDIGFDRTRTRDKTEHLAAYGLGSPFPEDAKLCAALSAFWPAVAPDAARTFEPNTFWPTVSPLTDEEIGQVGNIPWDGVPGPQIVHPGTTDLVEYSGFAHIDYVENALQNKFSLVLTGQIDIHEYRVRILAMARTYRALDIPDKQKGLWSVLSFRKVSPADQGLRQAQAATNTLLQGTLYGFQIYRHGQQSAHPYDHRKRRIGIREIATVFVDPVRILLRRGTGTWQVKIV